MNLAPVSSIIITFFFCIHIIELICLRIHSLAHAQLYNSDSLSPVFLKYHENKMIVTPTKISHEYKFQSIKAVNSRIMTAIAVKISSFCTLFFVNNVLSRNSLASMVKII